MSYIFKRIRPLTPFFAGAFFMLLWSGCSEKVNPNFQKEAANPDYMYRSLDKLTSVIKHDIFPPMIASRIYAYAQIAAYEAAAAGAPDYVSMAGQLKGLQPLPKPQADAQYCFPVASVRAYLKVGRTLIFSEDSINQFEAGLLKEMKAIGVPKDVFDRSVAFGDTVGGAILTWAKKDNYAQTRSASLFPVNLKEIGRWRPTSPDYATAFEPHWAEIKSMIMDTCSQFMPPRPPKFDTLKNSEFYKQAYEVFKVVEDSAADKIATARYWDDSPGSTMNAGHVNFLVKKVTPGGHWLHIAEGAAKQKGFNWMQSSEALMMASVCIYDGFISCWDEKYRSCVLRPESYISKYIKSEWQSVIVNPPFPEYPSGHSVVSGAASTVLNNYFGGDYRFIDSTETQFGLGARTFNSFDEAAKQAAISRLYGGIHYRAAVENGLEEGKQVADFVFKKIRTKKSQTALPAGLSLNDK